MVSISRLKKRGSLALVLLIIGLLGLQMISGLSSSGQAQASAAIPNTDVNPYGVNTFFDKEVEYWKKERTMQMINQAGIKWIKQIFAWNEIEFKKGYFNDDKNKKSAWTKYDEIVDLANKYDVKIVARIDQTPTWAKPASNKPGGHPANYQDYADFLKAFVQHYKGKIEYITVWNEPNLESEWVPGQAVNAGQYVSMLKLAYQSIKQTDPNVKVMAAPLAITLEEGINMNELKYLDQMYKAGAKNYFDIMPANAYGLEFPPEAAPNAKVLNFRRVELLHDVMVNNGDTNKAVWFNEYGWNASPANVNPDTLKWRRVTEQQQADYTIKGIKYARQNWPWAGVIFVWFFRQVGDIPDSDSVEYFQLVTKDFVAKPVYDALKQDAVSFLQQQSQATPPPITLAAPPTTAGTATTAPVVTTPIASTTTVAAVVNTPVNATTAPAVAVVPKTSSSTTTAANTLPPANGNSDNGSLLPLVLGGVVVVGAGGGLAYWATRRRQS